MSPIAAKKNGFRAARVAGLLGALVVAVALSPPSLNAMGLRTGDATPPASDAAADRDPDHVPDEVLVKFRGDLAPESRAALLAPLGLREKRPVGGSGVYLLAITDGSSVADAIARLQSLPQVDRAEPNAISTVPPQPLPPRPMQ